MSSELKIRTPEGITFAYTLAGPVTRCLAAVMDLFCVGVLSKLLAAVLAVVGFLSADVSQALLMVGYFATSIAYGVLSEWGWRGQTVGKRLLGLRVMDAAGLRLQFSQVLMRNLLRPVDMLPAFYLLGGTVSYCSGRAQRIGDLAAGTVVVRQPARSQPDLDQLLAGKFNSLREHPHLAARLRQRTTPAQARIILQALVRREEFEPAARLTLFSGLAAHFKALAEFPPEVTEAMPDEQFIRNVADILYRRSAVSEV